MIEIELERHSDSQVLRSAKGERQGDAGLLLFHR